ncbi:MAG: hypothetical protein ACTSQY_09620, partial [Candidatus Odinarchaeia archaeon]
DNLNEIGRSMDIQKASQGKYNERYMEIVNKYQERDKTRVIGERTIDHFQRAFGLLIQETQETGKDILGEIYQAQITYGEHGQFFTPEHVSDFMSKMFLLGVAKENPNHYLIGQDIDERCCKMAVINLFIRNLSGEIRWGDSLTNKINKRWIIRKGGFIYENGMEESKKNK